MNIKEATEMLKTHKGFIHALSGWDFDGVSEAIDTVVSHYEKSEKVDFLKSAKQPSEITHPYDLSKK